jgi:hypothetical protein
VEFLGVALDPALNAGADEDAVLGAGEPVSTALVHAREDIEIATQARAVLAGSQV